jgi:MobC-like protein
MESEEKKNRHKGGRYPKIDPAVHRYSISLTAEENARFLTLFESSGMNVMAHFITACIFQKGIKTVKIDKATMDYYILLTALFGQFRAIGVNYNQVVKIMYRNFSKKKAPIYLYKLVKQTMEFALLAQKIIQLTAEFEEKYLKK